MSQVSPVNISNLTQLSDLTRFLAPFCNQVQSALSNGLTVNDNFQANVIGVTFSATPNTNQVINHGLANTPIGYLVIQSSVAGSVYNGVSLVLGPKVANLKCNTASMFAQILFF